MNRGGILRTSELEVRRTNHSRRGDEDASKTRQTGHKGDKGTGTIDRGFQVTKRASQRCSRDDVAKAKERREIVEWMHGGSEDRVAGDGKRRISTASTCDRSKDGVLDGGKSFILTDSVRDRSKDGALDGGKSFILTESVRDRSKDGALDGGKSRISTNSSRSPSQDVAMSEETPLIDLKRKRTGPRSIVLALAAKVVRHSSESDRLSPGLDLVDYGDDSPVRVMDCLPEEKSAASPEGDVCSMVVAEPEETVAGVRKSLTFRIPKSSLVSDSEVMIGKEGVAPPPTPNSKISKPVTVDGVPEISDVLSSGRDVSVIDIPDTDVHEPYVPTSVVRADDMTLAPGLDMSAKDYDDLLDEWFRGGSGDHEFKQTPADAFVYGAMYEMENSLTKHARQFVKVMEEDASSLRAQLKQMALEKEELSREVCVLKQNATSSGADLAQLHKRHDALQRQVIVLKDEAASTACNLETMKKNDDLLKKTLGELSVLQVEHASCATTIEQLTIRLDTEQAKAVVYESKFHARDADVSRLEVQLQVMKSSAGKSA